MSDPDSIYEIVRRGYAALATDTTQSRCCSGNTCCGTNAESSLDTYAQILGYDTTDLQNLPEGSNLGLSCGNPTALASLNEGDVVMDLGSGAGFDVFIAARKVGPRGHVIGVDMTPEMVAKARQNARDYAQGTGWNNVEFRLGEIEHLPCADNSIDRVISNCVINLSPDKPQVWREIARVLKPGGKAAISDLALLRPLPEHVKSMAEALVGCVAGAVLVSETESMVHAAGLLIERKETHSAFLNALEETSRDAFRNVIQALPPGSTLRDFITSLDLVVEKPARGSCCC